MNITLTPEQIARVEYLASDDWVVDSGAEEDEASSWRNFSDTLQKMSAVELHHFTCNFNWDGGMEELDAVVEHPECDAGTALMIYWLAQPADYHRMAKRGNLSPSFKSVLSLLLKIEDRIRNNAFATHRIACDPTNIMGQPMTMGTDHHREVVPAQMFLKIDGAVIEPLSC